jgi:hypothetical protein
MKFPQVSIGQRLLFQGDAYVKVGPLTARRERDGETRLIPRSALVELTRSGAVSGAAEPAVSSEQVSRALAAYEEALRSVLLSPESDADVRLQGRLDAGLGAARRAFGESLAGSDGTPKGSELGAPR